MRTKILVSPLAKAAYFDAWREVAEVELAVCGVETSELSTIGDMDFFEVDVAEDDLKSLARSSFAQGLFRVEGEGLVPLEASADFAWPEALVYGQKYQGKTNELVTRLAINVGLKHMVPDGKRVTLLDPMAGRGTTLMWALRYGFDARGVEIDDKSTELFHAHIKKQSKLARLKHRTESGRIGQVRKQGKFERFTFDGQKITMVSGDSRLPDWTENRHFNLIVADLPYGIQHKGDEKRNPLSMVEECAPHWAKSLKKGGAMVLIFNTYQTKRAALATMFEAEGLGVQDFAAPHRMSESIIRDLIVFRRG